MPAPKKNVAYSFCAALVDQANRPEFKITPTLAAGDFKISGDGGALANLTALPVSDPAGSIIVKIALSQAEMNFDRIMVMAKDVAGAEWDSVYFFLETTAVTVDDLVRSTIPANSLAVDASGRCKIQSGTSIGVALPNFEFLMTDSTTHAPVTGKTVSATRSIDKAPFASCANAVTEIASGVYGLDLAAGDMNGGVIDLRLTAAGCDDLNISFVTTP